MTEPARDIILVLAKQVIVGWNSIDSRVRKHEEAHKVSDEMKQQLVRHMREAVGGEEVYEAARQLLSDCGLCADCAGGGTELNPSPQVLDQALCSGNIPILCFSCHGSGTTEPSSEEE